MTEAFNIDCMAAMSEMKDNEFNLAIVDPPYGIGDFSKQKKTGDSRWRDRIDGEIKYGDKFNKTLISE